MSKSNINTTLWIKILLVQKLSRLIQTILNPGQDRMSLGRVCQAIFQTLNKDSSHIAGKFCGESLPSSILISSSSIQLRFISDATDYATGFNLTYKALKPSYHPGKTIYFYCLISRPFEEDWHHRSWR